MTSSFEGAASNGSKGIAVALLLASTAALAIVEPARAAEIGTSTRSGAGVTRVFAIPPGSLNDALSAFKSQSGLQLSVDAGLLRGISSPGAMGSLTPQEALSRLFAGTGLSYRLSGDVVVLEWRTAASDVSEATVVSPVEVQIRAAAQADPYADPRAPYKADRLSSTKFSEPVLNTPRAVTILTRQALEDKDATTLRDVLRSTAGVTLGSGEGGNAFGDRFFIRGFDARNDVFIDGVRDPGVAIRENFDTEQVEILRGPASAFAGRGTTGGALNIVTKEAQASDFYVLEGQGGFSDSTRRGTVDLNKVVSPELDVRLNAMVQYAGVAGRDYATDNRWGVAAAVTYRPTPNIKINANFSHTYLWGLPDFGVPYNQVARLPATQTGVPRDTYYGIVNRDFTRSSQDVGTLDASWKVNDLITIENKLRVSHSLLDYLGTTPENPSATNPLTAPYSSTPTFNSGYVQLNAQSRYEPVDVITEQPQATFRFDTGPLRNTVIVGGEFSSERLSLDSYSGYTSELTTGPVVITSTGAPVVSEYDPIHYLYGSTGPALTGNPLRYNVDTVAGYILDTTSWHDAVIVSGGVRYDDYRIRAANNISSRTAVSGITSYNLGLVLKPARSGSVYVAYATAADPVGDELDATSSSYGGLAAGQNATQIFGPQRSASIEGGVKWQFFNDHLLATVAGFQTNVWNARETAPAGLPGYTSGQIVAGAKYRVTGVDLEVAGNITDQWSVLGGLVLMDPRVTKSIVPTNVGLQLANIAPQSFNLLSKYQVSRWLELGGQATYASEIKGGSLLAANGNVAYPKPPNPTVIPSHWRLDIFAETRLNDHASLKLYVQNLLDQRYYDAFYQSAQPFIQIAPGRAVSLMATVKF
jgi:catecholate siderophore receptor